MAADPRKLRKFNPAKIKAYTVLHREVHDNVLNEFFML